MRAFVVTGRGVGAVEEVDPPTAGHGQVVVDVHRVGICGTDLTLFSADEARLRHARSGYPLRLGHEWVGVVSAVGDDGDPSLIGRRVTGDTMLGCGHCERCLRGNHYVCEDRYEIGVLGGWPGALAEQLLVPVTALHQLPDSVSDEAGAMVEPGANAYRAVDAAAVGPDSRLLVLGPGTIGVLCALFAQERGAEVHLMGPGPVTPVLPGPLRFAGAWTPADLPALRWDAVVDATNGDAMPAFAAEAVEPSGRVVYIGISAAPSLIDSRTLVRKDVTAVGILGGSQGLAATISAYAEGRVDPTPLIARTVALTDLPEELSGRHAHPTGTPPKVHVDPAL